MVSSLDQVKNIIVVDTEYKQAPGEHLRPRCLCYEDLTTNISGYLWLADGVHHLCPWPTGPRTLVVMFAGSGDMQIMLTLDWERPTTCIDLFTEFLNLRNGSTSWGAGLLDALSFYKIDHMSHGCKEAGRELALQDTWTEDEKDRLLKYCGEDVTATKRLWLTMKNRISIPHAIIRGRYIPTVAAMESTGIPVDQGLQSAVLDHGDHIEKFLRGKIQGKLPIFSESTLKKKLFNEWLNSKGYPWPLTPTGLPKMDDNTLRDLSFIDPAIPLLRDFLRFSQILNNKGFPIGPDSMCRFSLRPFEQETSRNNASSSEFPFLAACWMRAYIKPPKGWGLAYVDYSSQEVAIAAWVSQDPRMIEDYRSGDFYISFGIRAEILPKDATKKTHPAVREQLKIAVLALNYGMQTKSLSIQLGCSQVEASSIARAYREAYRTYHAWSDRMLNATLCGKDQTTVFGWRRQFKSDYTKRGASVVNSIKNFPMQANAAEMTRFACIRAVESGIKVCCPVHDALLVMLPLDGYSEGLRRVRECMKLASLDITGDLEVRTGVTEILYPNRYIDPRGASTWQEVKDMLTNNGWWIDRSGDTG